MGVWVSKKKPKSKRKPDWIVQKDKDLRIPGATPEEMAKRVVAGGAPRRSENSANQKD